MKRDMNKLFSKSHRLFKSFVQWKHDLTNKIYVFVGTLTGMYFDVPVFRITIQITRDNSCIVASTQSIQAEEKPEFEPELLEYMGHVSTVVGQMYFQKQKKIFAVFSRAYANRGDLWENPRADR